MMANLMRVLCVFLLSAACSFAAGLPSCRAQFDGAELTIANSHVERKWRVVNGLLYAVSFRDLDNNVEWLARPSSQPAPYPAAALPEEKREVTFTQKTGRFSPVEAESLVVELATTGSVRLTYRFQVFPDARGISVQLTAVGTGAGPASTSAGEQGGTASGIEVDRGQQARQQKIIADAMEVLDLAPQHLRLTQVRLADQTDNHNELVFENEWLLHTAEPLRLPGNLFIVENTLTGNGLIFLKEAPLPHARPVKNEVDLTFEPQNWRIGLLGQGTDGPGEGYRHVVLSYSRGRVGRIEALHAYQRQLRVYDPKRDAMFLSNTWGNRSRDGRINEQFLTKEVHAGAKLGVDVIQIDDGWQKGASSNSVRAGGVWAGYWDADPEFWNVNPERFPNGLAPIIKLAAASKMRFGLWFAPDSSNDFANWEKDAAKILELHRTFGVDYVKIDSVRANSKTAERNLRRFFDRVLEESRGAVSFDLDVTAQVRPGYFGMINVGPLFVENRYTDWHRYWPHHTLRNLWKLAQYVDPARLRMEFLNNSRNTQLYPDDPLGPAQYSPSYLFATVMFSNPLGWFEISNLPASYFEELPPLIARWKQERAGIFSGSIIPIGEAPDGVAWTGFVSVAKDGQSGYALLFRELNPSPEWEFSVPMFGAPKYSVTVLGGAGSVSIASGKLRARIPETKQFVWVKIERPGTAAGR